MRMRVGLALLVVFSLTHLMMAATGRLSGVITDNAGAVLPGVTVTLSLRDATSMAGDHVTAAPLVMSTSVCAVLNPVNSAVTV